jgi:hypothetical protein
LDAVPARLLGDADFEAMAHCRPAYDRFLDRTRR